VNAGTVASHAALGHVRGGEAVGPRLAYDKVFVVGCGRSGTTWVQECLSSAPEIVTTQESHAYENLYAPLLNAGNKVRTWSKILHRFDMDERRQRWVGLYWWVTRRDFIRVIERELSSRDTDLDAVAKSAVRSVFDSWFAGQGAPGRTLLEKTPGHVAYGPVILDHFPEARIIEVVRDGRDVCVSLEKHALTMDWPPTSRRGQIELWVRAIEHGRRLHDDPRWSERVRRVHYEDLLADPHTELTRLLQFCGVDVGPATLDEIIEANLISGQRTSEGGHRRKGVAGDWKNVLTPEDVALFDELAGELSTDLGYDGSGRVR
jgi:hypothetical protein